MMRKLKKLTVLRLLNILKVYFSYMLSVVFKYPKRWGYPVTLSVEPTAECNLACPQCPTGMNSLNRKQSEMDFELFKQIADETSPYISAMILYFMGEPYKSEAFLKCVAYASKTKNIYTISSTNGHFLSKEKSEETINSGLDELIISIDGLSQKSYAAYRKNGNLKLVMRNTERLIRMKKERKVSHPKIIIQTLMLKSNQDEIDEIRNYVKRIGADEFRLKSAQFYDYESGNELMPSDSKYSRYKTASDGSRVLKRKLKNRCRRLWETSVITWDGELLPCCFDKDARHTFGNVSLQSFKELNSNNKAVSFRKNLLNNRKGTKICRNCTE
ncbi:MAG: radical SAM/SPASM domain-containing protein [Bacteroidota bacterium]|nr:radical SAM/SPASM domain-containing protein [Bacteroidota bacterium]